MPETKARSEPRALLAASSLQEPNTPVSPDDCIERYRTASDFSARRVGLREVDGVAKCPARARLPGRLRSSFWIPIPLPPQVIADG